MAETNTVYRMVLRDQENELVDVNVACTDSFIKGWEGRGFKLVGKMEIPATMYLHEIDPRDIPENLVEGEDKSET